MKLYRDFEKRFQKNSNAIRQEWQSMTTRLLLILSKFSFKYRVLFIKIELSKHENHDTRKRYVDINSILRHLAIFFCVSTFCQKKFKHHLLKIRKTWWKQFDLWKHALQKKSNVKITLLTTYRVTHRFYKRISILSSNRQLIDSMSIIFLFQSRIFWDSLEIR